MTQHLTSETTHAEMLQAELGTSVLACMDRYDIYVEVLFTSVHVKLVACYI